MMLPTLPSITFFLEIIIVIICHFFFYLLLLLLLLPSNYHFIMLCLPCCFFHLFIFIFHFILLLLFALRISAVRIFFFCAVFLSVCVSLNYLKCTFFLAFIVGSRLLLTLQKAPRHLFTLLPFLASSSSVVFSLSTPFGLDLSVDSF